MYGRPVKKNNRIIILPHLDMGYIQHYLRNINLTSNFDENLELD